MRTGMGMGIGFYDNLISFEGGLDHEPLQGSPAKRRRGADDAQPPPPVYPFFGEPRPPATKQLALSVLDFLGNADLYSMSLASTFWARAAMDDALWAPLDMGSDSSLS